MPATCVQCPWRPEESVGFTGAGVIGTCEPDDIGVGTEPGSSAKVARVLNHCAISLAPLLRFL